MIKGIGVDAVFIPRTQALLDQKQMSFFSRTFTPFENEQAEKTTKKASYYAKRSAAKEATFKAIAHLLPDKHFDLRIIETRNAENGEPYTYINDELSALMASAGITSIQLSLTDEHEYAIAFVIVE